HLRLTTRNDESLNTDADVSQTSPSRLEAITNLGDCASADQARQTQHSFDELAVRRLSVGLGVLQLPDASITARARICSSVPSGHCNAQHERRDLAAYRLHLVVAAAGDCRDASPETQVWRRIRARPLADDGSARVRGRRVYAPAV